MNFAFTVLIAVSSANAEFIDPKSSTAPITTFSPDNYITQASSQSEMIILQSDKKAALKVWPNENERLKHRFKEAMFPSHMNIRNSVIACDSFSVEKVNLFSMPTWTCHNIRVDGRRLPYAYLKDPKVPRSDDVMPAMRTKHCGDFEVGHSNRDLCAAMLAKLGIKTQVTEVQIPSSSCQQSPTGRAFYTFNNQRNVWEWRFNSTGSGFAVTLRCSSQVET